MTPTATPPGDGSSEAAKPINRYIPPIAAETLLPIPVRHRRQTVKGWGNRVNSSAAGPLRGTPKSRPQGPGLLTWQVNDGQVSAVWGNRLR